MTSTQRLLQYAKSTDPKVLETIEANVAATVQWRADVAAFAERFGCHTFYRSAFGGRQSIRALAGNRPTEGQWAKGPGGLGWRPRKGSALEVEMRAIALEDTPVPGLPMHVEGSSRGDFSFALMTPALFIHDGVAWAGLSEAPAPGQTNAEAQWGPEWDEVRGSEYLAAKEDREDEIAAEKAA